MNKKIKSTRKTNGEVSSLNPKRKNHSNELYKPISCFEWRDASEKEIEQSAIKAYEKFAF